MPDPRFYVGAQDEHRNLTGFVPAKFLMRNGAYVMDPTPGGSQKAFLFSDASGGDKTDGKIANPYNYLIVPDGYTEQKARDFASGISDSLVNALDETGGAAGLVQALLDMKAAFQQHGSQDLQRNPQWGVPNNSFVPAFVGGASDHLGYVTALSGLPKMLAEIAGGRANKLNAANQEPTEPPIDTSGPHGLSWHNYSNLTQGFSAGLAASQPPAPLNDYGYGPQAQPEPDQIGDGIAPWISAMSGIDPQEPPPLAWPPQADTPIRYLSRRTQ
jgi:hypothetical protein